jgi:uncharacterized membrane protein
VKQKQKKELERVQAVSDYAATQHEEKIRRWKERFALLREEVAKEKERWIEKYNNLETQLSTTKDRVYAEKAKCRSLVQKQILETERVEMYLRNYADVLKEENEELRHKIQSAIKDKHLAERASSKDKKLAKERLEKWHAEKQRRRIAEDYAAEQEKIANDLQQIMKRYQDMINNSQETKRKLQKEWADEEAKHKRGGARRWPIWVVQLICELLVNGTSPSAIPANIQTMYETLTGETPADVPSVNFVRQCRVVVEVIGETITALKLASAEDWKAIWTDATTRRQISFTALVIGLLGDEETIDPVVVSSCIFMEDERANTQADGIVSKVSDTCTNANIYAAICI